MYFLRSDYPTGAPGDATLSYKGKTITLTNCDPVVLPALKITPTFVIADQSVTVPMVGEFSKEGLAEIIKCMKEKP